MKTHLSKLALGAASMFMTTSAIAYMDMDDRLDTLEKEMQEISARNPQGTLGAGFTTARPDVDGTNWFLVFDVIYWHPKMGGTEYAITYNPSDFIGLPPIISEFALTHRENGGFKENDFSWDLGLKVGIGYKTPHDKWDVFARYTWYETHSTSQTRKNFPAAVAPQKTTDQVFAHSGKSTVDIEYDNVDLELARSMFISRRLSFRPFMSLKSAWIDLSQRIVYSDGLDVAFPPQFFQYESDEIKTNLSSKFWGLGPRVGVDSKYYLGNGFSFFGDVAGSILFGYFKTRQKDFIPNIDIPGLPDALQDVFNINFGSPTRSLKNKFHRFIPFAQMYLGLEWNKFFRNNKNHLGLKFGYEVQYYWRVNQMEHVGNTVNFPRITEITIQPPSIKIERSGRGANEATSKDLMFYGITGEARLDF